AEFALDEEREHYLEETSTIISRGVPLPTNVFGLPRLFSTFIPTTAAITIEGTVFAYTEPTPEWLTIYPSIQLQPSLDILEDLDIPFRPKRKRKAMGIVIKRSKARFKTAFADDLVEETNISE
ncbi:unnamed protein product, partial [marine sediment metagenome]